MKKFCSFFLIIITLCICLSSCSYHSSDDFYVVDITFPEIKEYMNLYVPGMEYRATYADDITREFLKEHPYTEGYYGHYLDEDLYWTFRTNKHGMRYAAIDLYVDERILCYFKFDDEVYIKAKEQLLKNFELSADPVEEYNNYVFYDHYTGFGEKYPTGFDRISFNDTNNTVILLGMFSTNLPDSYEDCDWSEYLEIFYGGWYDFSQ